jgi:HK97 family phage major capsid protein
LQDAAFDIVPFVGQYFGEAMNKTFGAHACVGSGSGMPQGYTAGSVTVQAAGTCSPDSAIKLQMSVNQRYRAGGRTTSHRSVQCGDWTE